MSVERSVWVTHRFASWHRWEDAPEHRGYLAHPHRHLFHVRVELDVTEGDREVEFHDLLKSVAYICENEISANASYCSLLSCEQMAEAIALHVRSEWGQRPVIVEVSEDGECGGRVMIE